MKPVGLCLMKNLAKKSATKTAGFSLHNMIYRDLKLLTCKRVIRLYKTRGYIY